MLPLGSKSAFCLLFSALALSACGGGGGGADDDGSFFLSPGESGDQVKASEDAIITLVGSRNDPTAISFQSGNQTIAFDETEGSSITNAGGFVQALGPGDQEGWFDTRQTYVVNGRSRTTRAFTGPFSDEVFFVGVDGEKSETIPLDGSPTYVGQAIGYFYDPASEKLYTTRSDVSLSARFANNSVFFRSEAGVAYHPDNETRNLGALALSGDLAINGTDFSGTIDAPGGRGTVGSVNGSFYGPDALEAGGVFEFDYGTFAGASSFSASSD